MNYWILHVETVWDREQRTTVEGEITGPDAALPRARERYALVPVDFNPKTGRYELASQD